MNGKPSLYELLDVAADATAEQLQAAYVRQIAQLDAAGDKRRDQGHQRQLLRLALTTLTDPVSRVGYDAKLAAASRPASPVDARGLMPVTEPPAISPEARAEALALRAEALALRADALLLRAGLAHSREPPASVVRGVAAGALTLAQRLAGALGLLVVVWLIAFFATRMVRGDVEGRQAAMEAKAHEQTALQEYERTHGVRPANMAELELLQADQQRRRIESWQATQNAEKREREARQFIEESRERGRQVAQELRATEEQARRDAEQEQLRKQQEEQLRQETERARLLNEQIRVERERQQWREVLAR